MHAARECFFQSVSNVLVTRDRAADAASLVCAGPPAAESGVGKDLVRAALAGGIASSTSTLVLHPLDTLKTRIQVLLIYELPRSAAQVKHWSVSDSQS